MVKLELQYVDPRLVELYDSDNSSRADTEFYISLAAELDAHRILDLGCGTGLLTRELATEGREVTGVDPASAMLVYARRQPGAERVQWLSALLELMEWTASICRCRHINVDTGI